MHRSLGDFYCNSEFCCATRRTHLPTDVFRPKATTPSLRDSLALYGDSPRRRVATSTYLLRGRIKTLVPISPRILRIIRDMFYPSIDPSVIYHTRGWMDNWLRIKRKKIRIKNNKRTFSRYGSLTVALSIVLHHSTTTTSSSSRLLHLLHLKSE